MTTQQMPAQQWDGAVPSSTVPPQVPGHEKRVRYRVIALGIALAVAAGAIVFLVTVVVPYASAAGGCGGG